MTRVEGLRSFTLALLVAGPSLALGCSGGSDSGQSEAARGGNTQGNGGSAANPGLEGGATGVGGAGNANGGSNRGGGQNNGGASSGGMNNGAGNSARGGASAVEPTKIRVTATGVPVERIARSVLNPTGSEYEGMGEHAGESVVLGLKIQLTGISLNEKPPGQPGDNGGLVFDWSAAPRELAIESGFSGSIEDEAILRLPEGNYQVVQVNYLSQYDLKAYAYLDTDKDGEIDTTIYTTATGVASVARLEVPENLPDLDYQHYGFTYTHNADSATASTTTSFDFTLLPSSATVGTPSVAGNDGGAAGSDVGGMGGEATTALAEGAPGGAGAGAEGGADGAALGGAGGSNGADGSKDLSITLFIDAYRVVKAWDGTPPSSPSDHVDVLFPQGSGEARSNGFGIDLVDLYPIGQPTFGLQYLPTFAFANQDAGDYSSETYLIAPSEPFLLANTQTLSVIFDGNGVPVIGRAGGNVDRLSLQLGQAARMFEQMGEDDGTPLYRYYVEYGIRDANNVDDGGMYYHNDPGMAGHTVEGFRHLASVGDTTALVVKDGPRCNAEYNRCYGNRVGVMRRVR